MVSFDRVCVTLSVCVVLSFYVPNSHSVFIYDPPPETSHLVAGGNRFIAVALERKGCIGLYSIKDLPDSKAKQHVIHAHNAKVGDLQWSPHDSRILMSGGADGKLKLWSIAPEGLSNDCKDHQASLCIELGAINQVQWHPSAANVAAVACKEGE